MNYQQVLALIQQFIVANGNNEITANVLRPILEAILAQPNELIGDLDDLQTTDQSNLVNAINEVLNNIAPQIGSVNTKIHALSLSGIDPDLPELTKIAEAVRLHGPFTCDVSEQMVFKTITTVGDIDAGAIVITRYYRLLRNVTTIGGPITQQVLPSWFMQDGVSEYANPDADGTIIELGDIGTSEVWDVFNLGNNGDAWDMNEYRFVRATQNGGIQLWAFVGQERYYGGPDMGIEPDIFEAFEDDFFLITDQSDEPAPFNTFETYTDVAAMIADQANQADQVIYQVTDASGDANLEFETGETKLQAFYRYNGVATGSIDDYTLISAPYGNYSATTLEGYHETGTRAGGDLEVVIGDWDNSSSGEKLSFDTHGLITLSKGSSLARIEIFNDGGQSYDIYFFDDLDELGTYISHSLVSTQNYRINRQTTGGIEISVDETPAGVFTKQVIFQYKEGTVALLDDLVKLPKTISDATYILLEEDKNKILHFTNATGVTVTVPTSLTLNNRYEGKQMGAGQVTFVAETGVTINKSATDTNKTADQYSVFGLDCTDTDEYVLFGKLELV